MLCLQVIMQIAGGSGHFHLTRDPPAPYTANISYSAKQPRQISVSFCVSWCYTHLYGHSLHIFRDWIVFDVI